MKSIEKSSTAEKKLGSNSNDYTNITKKIQDINLDDVDCQEQPINYSLKYPEESGSLQTFIPHSGFRESPSACIVQENNDKNSSIQSTAKSECRLETQNPLYAAVTININIPQKQLPYDSYTETDMDNLDQPIDYSRKYHEYGIDDYNQHIAFNNTSSHHLNYLSKDPTKLAYSYEDTVKIFCTEDTPLNFSSASSLTDLRDVGLSGLQTPNSCFDENLEKNVSVTHTLKDKESAIDSSRCQFLSTVVEDKESINDVSVEQSVAKEESNSEDHLTKADGEANIDETPLMFSRSSSLCSLNSFEQHSIHDDQSSMSDVSQMNSGAISPSDLPDSPPCCAPKTSEDNDRSRLFFPSTLSPLNLEDDIEHSEEKLLNSIDSSNNLSHLPPIRQISSETLHATTNSETSNSDRAILEKFIQLGMPKKIKHDGQSNSGTLCKKTNSEDSTSDRAILDKFIQLGMPKKKNNILLNKNNAPTNSSSTQASEIKIQHESPAHVKKEVKVEDSSSSKSVETSESDKAILEKYIRLGMPKAKESNSYHPRKVFRMPNISQNEQSEQNLSSSDSERTKIKYAVEI